MIRYLVNVILFAALVALFPSCCTDGSCNVPEPARYGTVKIALGDSLTGDRAWRADQRAALDPLVRELDALGPDFVWGSPADPDTIVIRPEALEAGTCGFYRLGESSVAVDPVCTAGFAALRKAAAHEVVHALLYTRFGWGGHLCWFPLNSPVPAGCHPTRVCRDCLLSPAVQGQDSWEGGVENYTPAVAIPEPQPEDVALVRACFERGRCE